MSRLESAHGVACNSLSSNPEFAACGPTVCVCVRVCMCVGNMQCYCQKQTTKAGVLEWPATKQEEDCDEKKTQVELKNEVRTKGRTYFFCFFGFAN